MRAFDATIGAIVTIFTVSVFWLATRGPFETVVASMNATMNKGLSVGATSAMNNMVNMFTTSITIFIIITVLCLIYWWWMKMQEREIVTEAVYG